MLAILSQPYVLTLSISPPLCSYAADEDGRVGLYVSASPLTPDNNYFEVEVLDTGACGAIGE